MQINQEIGLDSPLISPSYKHFAMLPDRAFQPRNGRSGMTLEGGRGGGGGSPEPIQEAPPAPPPAPPPLLRPSDELGDKIFTGYQQLFGRPPDPGGYDYWMKSFEGLNLNQAEINRSLLSGSQGSDIPASDDYLLSLIGGRPGSVESRVARGQTGQFFQPIYNPSSRDYMPTQQAPAQTFFNQGFNPLNFTAGPQVASSGTFNPFSGGVNPNAARMQSLQNTPGMFDPFDGGPNPYAATMQSLPSAPVAPQSNPFLASYLAAYGQEGGVGQGESGQGGGVG